MSRTFRNERYNVFSDGNRPAHQVDRGPRHGKNRKMYARLKWQERKSERARNKYNWNME